jgi:riboflavin kinase/FMN adenylyltransferase
MHRRQLLQITKQPMKIFRGINHPGVAPACAVTIGNFDGVHRGHQAMLGLLKAEAAQRGIPSCAMTFEPHPRDYFAQKLGKPGGAGPRGHAARQAQPARGLRRRSGRDPALQPGLASQSPEDFIQDVLISGLGAKYVLVGDDFRFGPSAPATTPCWTTPARPWALMWPA